MQALKMIQGCSKGYNFDLGKRKNQKFENRLYKVKQFGQFSVKRLKLIKPIANKINL